MELRRVTREDFPLISRWLAEPQVARWWNDPATPEAVEAQFGPSVDGTDPTAVYLGLDEGRPFGLVQVYAFADEPESLAELSAICPVPAGALSVDYFVGEAADRGRGLGAALIAAAVERGFADHPEAQDVLVPVVAGNVASWRALLRAGATWYAEGDLTPDNPIDPPAHVVHRFRRGSVSPSGARRVPRRRD